MRKHLIEDAAYEVATQIRTVEDTIDSALTEISELQCKIIHVSSISGSSVGTAQAAVEQLAASLQALVSARGGMARCHAELVEAKKFVPGLRTLSFGEGYECPPMAMAPDLRVVA